MSDPFIAEIRIFGFEFAPRGWAACDGQLLPISQNTALFSLIGTAFGGNGSTNFALPDLQGSSPMGAGQGPGLSPRQRGGIGGVEYVTLLKDQMPKHDHPFRPSVEGGDLNTPSPMRSYATASGNAYQSNTTANLTQLHPKAVGQTGQNQSHNNVQPSLCSNFSIALQGVFPPRG